MSRSPAFSIENKRRLVQLLIEAFESDLPRLEESLLEVVTRPAPAVLTPRIIDEEPNLRMAISNTKENLQTLRGADVHIPEVPAPRAGIFSLVQTRLVELDTWYFITPCEYYFERELPFDDARLLACHRSHFLLGVQRGDTYSSGGSWNTHTGEVYDPPLVHQIVEIC